MLGLLAGPRQRLEGPRADAADADDADIGAGQPGTGHASSQRTFSSWFLGL